MKLLEMGLTRLECQVEMQGVKDVGVQLGRYSQWVFQVGP
jgi:hypothetical protein